MVRVTCVLLVALVCSLAFVARADPVDELLNVEGAVQGDEQNIKDCRTFPGARDAVLNLDARCGQTLNEQTWTSVVGGHRLSVSGLKINRDATCPSVYFQRSPRTIPLNIGPSRFPALTIEVLARPRSFISAPYNWLVSGDSGNWGRSIVLRDPRMDGVSPAVGFFNPRFGLGRARRNRWIHLVSTFENNVESITYRNFFLTTKYRPTSPEGNNNLYIGGSQWGGHSVDADIAWVRVYADRLNADEVKQLFLRAAPCVASQCTSKPGQRAYGGGFGGRVRAGSVQDHIFTNGQTYIITADANECKLACAAHADCRTYVFAPSRACYRFTTGDLGSQPQAGFESGTCA